MPFGALVASARRVFGCEAVVILGRTSEVVDATGLGARELEELRRVPSSRGFFELGFEAVLSADVAYEGRRFGVLHALKRSGEAFDNAQLIGTFASQVAITMALRERAPIADAQLETWALLDQLVLSAHSLEELSRALSDVMGPLFGGATMGVMVADRQRNVLQMISGAFGAPDDASASHRVSFFDARSNSSRVLMTGRPYISNARARATPGSGRSTSTCSTSSG